MSPELAAALDQLGVIPRQKPVQTPKPMDGPIRVVRGNQPDF